MTCKEHKATKPGELVEIDTVVLFINNIKRYIITAIDVYGRFAYAKVYKSPSSANAKDFFQELEKVCPFTITHIQTDNGSECEKHFRKYIADIGIIWYNTQRSHEGIGLVSPMWYIIQQLLAESQSG